MTDTEIHKGLEGITVDTSRLSHIDGEAGELTIGGFSLSELAGNATYEETLYLLYNDELPDEDELQEFKNQLKQYRKLPEDCLNVVKAAGRANKDPMDALRMGSASINLDLEEDDPEKNKLALISRFPAVVAAYWRTRNGEDYIEPSDELSHAGNYIYMLTGEKPTDAQVRGLETYLNTVVDHGFNASTFTARTIVSTESDLVSAITGAVGALKGPLHGGAPGPVLNMLLEMQESGDVEGYIRDLLESGDRLMGFGHRVYNVRDPRAKVLSSAAEQFYEAADNSAFFDLAMEVEEKAVKLLEEFKPNLDIETNVEFFTAVLLHGIGIPSELFTTTFAVSRLGGWTAHSLEQLSDNRLIRPRSEYVGDKNRNWVPIKQR